MQSLSCFACRSPHHGPEDLVCGNCKQFQNGWPTFESGFFPTTWGKADKQYALEITWLEAAARHYGVPPPAQPKDLTGPWGDFVLALHHHYAGNAKLAATHATAAIAGPDVPGFAGLKDHARIILEASKADANLVQIRKFRVAFTVELPALPDKIAFQDPAWSYYAQAVQALRVYDHYRAHILVYKGLKSASREDHPAIPFLKALGKSITKARRPADLFAKDYRVRTAEDVLHVLQVMGVKAPGLAAAGGPAWLSLGQAFVDFDRQAWQVAYQRIQEAWALPGEDRKALVDLLKTLTKRIPAKRRTRRILSATSPKTSNRRRIV